MLVYLILPIDFHFVEASSRQWQVDSAKGTVTISRQGDTMDLPLIMALLVWDFPVRVVTSLLLFLSPRE